MKKSKKADVKSLVFPSARSQSRAEGNEGIRDLFLITSPVHVKLKTNSCGLLVFFRVFCIFFALSAPPEFECCAMKM